MIERQTLRVGIVGIGFGQQVHLPVFRAQPRSAVTAISASSQERADAVAARYGIPHAFGSWQALVDSPDVDVVAIATPPAVQVEIVRASLEAGKPVFCEKPLAPTAEQALELVKLADQKRIPCVVDFQFREISAWQKAKNILDSGEIGQLRHIAINWNVETYANKMGLSDSWKTRVEAGGGALNSFVSHSFYYIEWLAGRIKRLSAHLGKAPGDTRTGDTIAVLCLELETGCLVSLSVSTHAFSGSGHKLEFYGVDGTLVLENKTADYMRGFELYCTTRSSNQSQAIQVDQPDQQWQDGRVEPVSKLANRLIEWILNHKPAAPTLADAWRVQTLLDAAQEANSSGCRVDTSR